MKTRTSLLIIILLFAGASSYGQIGRLIRNKAAKVLNDAAKEEADTLAQQQGKATANDAGKNRKGKNEANQDENQDDRSGRGLNIGGLFGGKVDLKYNSEYKFDSRMYMVMESYEKSQPTKFDYYIYYSKNVPSAGIEMKTVVKEDNDSVPFVTQMIVDGENKCMIVLTDINNMKMGMISELPDENADQSTVRENKFVTKTSDLKRTGNSKVIAGHKCDEYEYRDSVSNNLEKVWMTKDAVLNIDRDAWTRAGMPSVYANSGFEGMTVLAWEEYDKNNKIESKSEVVEINPSYSHSMSVQGYSLRQINYNQMQQQQQQNK